jgi:hypothetical protein
LEGKLEIKGHYYMFHSYEMELYSAFSKAGTFFKDEFESNSFSYRQDPGPFFKAETGFIPFS